MSKAAPRYTLGDTFKRPAPAHAHAVPYDPGEAPVQTAATYDPAPSVRSLTVYTQDPSTSGMDVSTARVQIPYEPLAPGPFGRVVRVIDYDETQKGTYEALDLDGLPPGTEGGLKPSTMDPRFAQQMTYALAMAAYEQFRRALGRTPDFAFSQNKLDEDRVVDPVGPGDPDPPPPSVRLHIHPHAMYEDNAYYDRERGALLFGYTKAGKKAKGLDQPGATVFTSLSHDVVVHETSHALLDGLRAKFLLPSNPDVDAFHEAFADIVALFHKFKFKDLVERAIADRPDRLDSRLLTDIARQFGAATGDGSTPLRSAMLASGGLDDPVERKYRYDPDMECHDLGAVLVAAVFDAFRWVYQKKTESLRGLGPAGGTRLPQSLVQLLAEDARRLADQFLNIVIRAIDYCPPVDLTFGEYLRALVTADHDITSDDPWCYREALVRGFRRYGITVDGVPDLSQDALLWRPPERDLGTIRELAYENLAPPVRPGRWPTQQELTQRAVDLGDFVTDPMRLWFFGLTAPTRREGLTIEPPVIESIRTLRRISPDNTLNFDLVAEVTQRRQVTQRRWMYGGATIIVGDDGRIRYSICKNVNSAHRERRFRAHVARMNPDRQKFFGAAPPSSVAALFKHMHEYRRRAE